mmetsp:Transcript_146131/g.207128  ORF Transcript_146131/g.207128 Transcript_146131/m.207128 type:complete len:535 (+) Transcript_146131:75-1679(+)
MLTGLVLSVIATASSPSHPNIVFFLTDDQDQVLGGSFPLTASNGASTPMPRTKALIADKGATATSFYIHTPICCPSRSETLSGRYLHNVKQPVEKMQCSEAYGGQTDWNTTCCMHVDEGLVNNATFAKYLKEEAGYTVGMFGKYLNNCPNVAQPGFDAWFANGGGSYFAPEFAVQNIDGMPDGSFKGNQSVYSTSIIGNVSLAWIRKVATGSAPFMAYIGPKAAHDPFQPAPWYADYWDPSWPATAPRPPSWNISAEARSKHHPTVANQAMLDDNAAACIDKAFKNRWRTLMSVDDLIDAVFRLTDELGVTDNTYFLYSSDHGFQMGELNLPQDKRNVYEFDTKIHMIVRGPGITAGSQVSFPGTNVDIGPTFLAMAGVSKPGNMDGKSFLPFIVQKSEDLPNSVSHGLGAQSVAEFEAGWRDTVFVEHYRVGAGSYCGEGHHIDGVDNNFIAIRSMPGSKYGNFLYAEFQWANGTNYGEGNVDFKSPFIFEAFDMDADPWQMNNIYDSLNESMKASLHASVHAWLDCQGGTCP